MPIREITVDELAVRLESSGVALVDVRQPGEYALGHVPSAVLMPLGEVPDRVPELQAAGELYLICGSGGRSRRACELLAGHGIEATNVAGGVMAWLDSGRAVVDGSPRA